MLIQYASDLHQEFSANRHWLAANPIQPAGDVLMLAGDTHPLGKDFSKLPLWNYLAKHFRETYVLPGNHEYYGGYNVATNLLGTKEAIRKNVWLVNNYVVEKLDVRLVFTTLWSRVEKHVGDVLLGMSDFHRIRYEGKVIGLDHYHQLHTAALNFLTRTLSEDTTKKTLVVTHHLPSEQCNAEEFRGSALNEAFCVDLTSLIRSSDVAAWLYGHSHRNVPEFRINNTHMLTNQLGYVSLGEHTRFRNDAVVALGD